MRPWAAEGIRRLLLAEGTEVLAIDRDPDAMAASKVRLGEQGITYLQSAYADDEALQSVTRFHPDFILLDLGVSSHQLDQDQRGFSFRPGAILDMRMEQEGPSAADLLNRASEAELRRIFADYGDEPRAGGLAREVVRRRATEQFSTSDHLVNAIRAVLGPRSGPGTSPGSSRRSASRSTRNWRVWKSPSRSSGMLWSRVGDWP